jgi:hypothetical protein
MGKSLWVKQPWPGQQDRPRWLRAQRHGGSAGLGSDFQQRGLRLSESRDQDQESRNEESLRIHQQCWTFIVGRRRKSQTM